MQPALKLGCTHWNRVSIPYLYLLTVSLACRATKAWLAPMQGFLMLFLCFQINLWLSKILSFLTMKPFFFCKRQTVLFGTHFPFFSSKYMVVIYNNITSAIIHEFHFVFPSCAILVSKMIEAKDQRNEIKNWTNEWASEQLSDLFPWNLLSSERAGVLSFFVRNWDFLEICLDRIGTFSPLFT